MAAVHGDEVLGRALSAMVLRRTGYSCPAPLRTAPCPRLVAMNRRHPTGRGIGAFTMMDCAWPWSSRPDGPSAASAPSACGRTLDASLPINQALATLRLDFRARWDRADPGRRPYAAAQGLGRENGPGLRPGLHFFAWKGVVASRKFITSWWTRRSRKQYALSRLVRNVNRNLPGGGRLGAGGAMADGKVESRVECYDGSIAAPPPGILGNE